MQSTELKLPPGEISSWNDDEYVLDLCPFCGIENKFVYNIKKTVGRCWICSKYVTSYKSLLWAVRGEYLDEVSFFKKPPVYTKADSKFLCNAWDHSCSRDFLKSRGVGELTSREIGMMFDSTSKTCFINITSISKDLPESFLWRKLPEGKWFPKKGTQAKYYMWNWESFENSKRPVLLTEGIFDLLSTKLYNKGIALLGSSPNNLKIDWLSRNTSKVLIWMDYDEAGWKANEEISEKCKYYGLPYEVILGTKHPKNYNPRIGSDKKFLEEVEKKLQ